MADQQTTPRSARFPWLFLGLTYGFSWAIWVPFILSGQTVNRPVPALIVACSMPSLVGILLTHFTTNRAGRADFWKRVVGYKLIGLKWYAVIACLFPFLLGLGLLTDKLFGGTLPPLRGAQQTLTQPAALALYIGVNIIGGPLGEELGWRGFALDRLQNQWNALVASLILGIVWTAWHFPLFYIKGTPQQGMGFGTPLFWFWSLQVVSLSVLTTWVYNNTHRSILSAVFMHFMFNSTYGIIQQDGRPLPTGTFAANTVMLAIAAVMVVGLWGCKTMTSRDDGREDVRGGHH
ncbi:MAG TPA: CPBP family intramembrane metalloprotease domain-containing protein [Syntrophobacteraceae bacterium]|nr:CPBP family intramembrane metalloprotease domain-containing protein [Syntrophobacteraceae bacterium]HBD06763.1 CPBP family intramembrane metalloprotease domain-containing protein [Syntrophobacteraceae bacterium]HBZ55899.1 CPBP family intramembrane metalloprotease domain-containing protein [Syntrophobacteraceae bacterium]